MAGDILSAEHLTYDQAKAFIEKPEIIMGSSFSDEDDDDEDPRQKTKFGSGRKTK